jgi:lipoprotein-anchoring transpeptidase ErfK/SrfK
VTRRRTRGTLPYLLLALAVVAFVLVEPTLSHSGGTQPGAAARAGPQAEPAATATAADRYQELAELSVSQEAFANPGADPLKRVTATRPITGEQTVLPVLGATWHGGLQWLHVRLPGRPNGTAGWIERSGTKLEYTPWRIVVSTARRRVFVYDAGRIARSFAAVVGAPATPTPKGQFFVEENVAEPPSFPGAPYALALSARSNVYQEFDGGPGQIAIHGVDNVGGAPGTAASHGCIRLETSDITWLADRIDPGVPVTIQ